MRYRPVLLVFLYFLFSLALDVYSPNLLIKIEQDGYGAFAYLINVLISIAFVLATLLYFQLSANQNANSAKIGNLIFSAVILLYPILIYPFLPQGVMNPVRESLLSGLSVPQKHAYITLAAAATFVDAVWKTFSKYAAEQKRGH